MQHKEKNREVVEKKQLNQKKSMSQSQKKRRKAENDWNEWEDLQKEENLYKKLKKGKITQKEFDKLAYDSDFNEEDDK